ncbi:ALP1-like protein [Tanacetum coccineum]
MSLSRLSDVMYTCIILHNMVIHDNGEAISPDFFLEEQHRDDDPVRTHEKPGSNDVKRIRYKQAHEATRKDVDRAFGVLKKKWAIVKAAKKMMKLRRR